MADPLVHLFPLERVHSGFFTELLAEVGFVIDAYKYAYLFHRGIGKLQQQFSGIVYPQFLAPARETHLNVAEKESSKLLDAYVKFFSNVFH